MACLGKKGISLRFCGEERVCGAVSLSYVGGFILAAVLVGALLVGALWGRIGGIAEAAICQVVQLGDPSGCELYGAVTAGASGESLSPSNIPNIELNTPKPADKAVLPYAGLLDSGADTGADTGVSSGDNYTTGGSGTSGSDIPGGSDGSGGKWMSPEVSGVVSAASDFFGTASGVLGALALGSLLIPVVGEVVAPILGTAAIITGGLAAAGDIALAVNGDKTWGEAALSAALAGLGMVGGGLARFGAKIVPRLLPGVAKAAGGLLGKAKGAVTGLVAKIRPKPITPAKPVAPKPMPGAKPPADTKSATAGLQDDAIAAAERTGPQNLSSLQKGNYGEMKMDRYFENQGYKRVSVKRVTDLNTPTHLGIDGVYYKTDGHPPYIIGEAKYGTSRLGVTKDGKQMSEKWIETRLAKAVPPEVLRDMQLQGYGSSLVKVSPEGNIITKALDAAGNIVK